MRILILVVALSFLTIPSYADWGSGWGNGSSDERHGYHQPYSNQTRYNDGSWSYNSGNQEWFPSFSGWSSRRDDD